MTAHSHGLCEARQSFDIELVSATGLSHTNPTGSQCNNRISILYIQNPFLLLHNPHVLV